MLVELISEVDLIPLMELIPIVEPIPFIDMIPTLMIPIPTYPHCSKGDSDSDSKNNWNHNTSNFYIFHSRGLSRSNQSQPNQGPRLDVP